MVAARAALERLNDGNRRFAADDRRHAYTGPEGQGMDFAPGLDPANYRTILDGTFPTANVRFEDGLHSPLTREFTASIGSQVSQRAHVKLTYVSRDAPDRDVGMVFETDGTQVTSFRVGTVTAIALVERCG